MNGRIPLFAFLMAVILFSVAAAPAATLWVDASYTADGDNDGHAWQVDAFSSIQEAMTAAVSGTTVYVADGRYVGKVNLKTGVDLIGAGPETTIIDANFNGCAVSAWMGATCSIDGFTITNGADKVLDGGAYRVGSGMFIENSTVTIRNCSFVNNSGGVNGGGGAIYICNSSPLIVNCSFINNAATTDFRLPGSTAHGGAIGVVSGNPIIHNCMFVNNSATATGGAIMSSRSMAIENCIFLNNSAATTGGAVRCYERVDFKGCTFVGNMGESFLQVSSPHLDNCIMWANETNLNDPYGFARNCNIQGSSSFQWKPWSLQDLGGNIDTDPLFADLDGADNVMGTVDDDVRLRSDSPCIDAGANEPALTGVRSDLAGRLRIWDGNCDGVSVVDMGAYEYKPVAADVTGDCSVDSSDLASMCDYWLHKDCTPCGGADLDLDADVTLTDLSVLASEWLI